MNTTTLIVGMIIAVVLAIGFLILMTAGCLRIATTECEHNLNQMFSGPYNAGDRRH